MNGIQTETVACTNEECYGKRRMKHIENITSSAKHSFVGIANIFLFGRIFYYLNDKRFFSGKLDRTVPWLWGYVFKKIKNKIKNLFLQEHILEIEIEIVLTCKSFFDKFILELGLKLELESVGDNKGEGGEGVGGGVSVGEGESESESDSKG